jgi:hypothetical protein
MKPVVWKPTYPLLILLLVVAACDSPNALPPAGELGELAMDTAQGVTFQPPIGKLAVANGDFDPEVSLSIEIFRLESGQPVSPRFSTADGTVKVVNNPGVEEHYHANWNTKAANLDNGTTVRIEVKLANAQAGKPVCNDGVSESKGCLAFVDMQLLQNKGKVTGGDSGDHFLDLVNGQTLPIKVHIEKIAEIPQELVLDPPGEDGGISGSYGSVRFSATPEEEGKARARYWLTRRSEEITIHINDYDVGEITWNGLAIDGYGVLTGEEEQALGELAASELADALAMIPLDLACHQGAADLGPAVGAALLMPWQMILKYLKANPAEVAEELASRSSCTYFADTMTLVEDMNVPSPAVVMLSPTRPIPAAFGYFPFDGEGAALTMTPAERVAAVVAELEAAIAQAIRQNEFHPVDGSGCFGRCGSGCNCESSRKELRCAVKDGVPGIREWTVHTCGAHRICERHDGCHISCMVRYGKDSFTTWSCHRGCDATAWAEATSYAGDRELALSGVLAFAMGQNLPWLPFEGREEFEYSKVSAGALENFTPCPDGQTCQSGECVTPDTPVIARFAANPTSIFPGDSSVLSWDVRNADTLSIDQGIGSVPSAGTTTVSPLETTSYTLTATNVSGTVTATQTVRIIPPVISEFIASPAIIAQGEPSKLSWVVAGASRLFIDHIGEVTGEETWVSPAETT